MTTPTYPSTLPEPSMGSYSFKPTSAVIRTDMESGLARVRRRFSKPPTEIDVTFKFTLAQLAVFEKFFDQDLMGGAAWFYINLVNGVGRSQFVARFKEGTYQAATDVREFNWTVQAKLEVVERPLLP